MDPEQLLQQAAKRVQTLEADLTPAAAEVAYQALRLFFKQESTQILYEEFRRLVARYETACEDVHKRFPAMSRDYEDEE